MNASDRTAPGVDAFGHAGSNHTPGTSTPVVPDPAPVPSGARAAASSPERNSDAAAPSTHKIPKASIEAALEALGLGPFYRAHVLQKVQLDPSRLTYVIDDGGPTTITYETLIDWSDAEVTG